MPIHSLGLRFIGVHLRLSAVAFPRWGVGVPFPSADDPGDCLPQRFLVFLLELAEPTNHQRAFDGSTPTGRAWLVTAMMMRSARSRWYGLLETTTAGRRLAVLWSVKGKGTKTMSPKL